MNLHKSHIWITLALAMLIRAALGQTPPIMPAIQPKTPAKALQTPKQSSLATPTRIRVPTPWIPTKVVMISWKPGQDGANVATVIEAATNDLQNPEWKVFYAGKNTNCLCTNDWGNHWFFRGSTTLTNL